MKNKPYLSEPLESPDELSVCLDIFLDDAKKIHRAVNSHNELLHALKMAVAWMKNGTINMDRMPRGIESFEELEQAIAKAEAPTK